MTFNLDQFGNGSDDDQYPADVKITDYFNVGDKVEWVTVRSRGTIIEIKKHSGVIDEIQGSRALIKSPGFSRRRRVSLFELKVI